jgi:hypothetical protein
MMDDVDERARRLILEYRRATGPSDARRDHVLHRVAASSAGLLELSSTPVLAATLGTTAAVIAVVVAVAVSHEPARDEERHTPVGVVDSVDPPSQVVVETSAEVVVDEASQVQPPVEPTMLDAERDEDRAKRRRVAPVDPASHDTSSPSSEASDLAAETRLLEAVDRALRDRDVAAADAALAAYARAFPNGVLGREAEGLAHMLACLEGRPGAEARATTWAVANSTTGLARRIHAACRIEGEGAR